MDKYHIYDEIGKGEFSQVFKGREKTKITYVAIKRVDKTMMNKIVNEVQIIHKMQNPHIIRFYDWYETTNNLWLILEYCTGSDLRSVLKQDGHLPEASITLFGLDILAGLKYIHSQGFIHCDLQPKNLLIDEYGIIKFSDFKFARKIPRNSLGDVPSSQRGCVPYMAPELFTPEGMHSFASDFWSLGCVLFELRKGFPPFGSLNEDQESVIACIKESRAMSLPLLPANVKQEEIPAMTAVLYDLIEWLLEKSPLERCTWDDVAKHPFWGENHLAPPINLPPQHSYDEYLRNVKIIRHEKMEEDVADEIGQPGHSNMQPPPPPSLLDNTPIRPKSRVSTDKRSNSGAQSPSIDRQQEVTESAYKVQRGAKLFDSFAGDRSLTRTMAESMSPGGVESESSPMQSPMAAKVGSFQLMDQFEECVFHNTDSQVKPLVSNKTIEGSDKFSFNAQNLPFSLLPTPELLKKPQTDLEAYLMTVFRALHKNVNAALSADSTSASPSTTNATMRTEESVDILAYISSIACSTEVANIVLNTNFSSLLLRILKSNESIWLRNASSNNRGQTNNFISPRVLVASIFGTLLRYATFVQVPDSRQGSDHLLRTLVDLQGTTDTRLLRKVVAAMGEMVFYIVAQEDDRSESQEMSPTRREEWPGLEEAFDSLIVTYLSSSDTVCRHYCSKAFENILFQGTMPYRLKLCRFDLAQALFDASINGNSDNFEASCASAFMHIVYLLLKSQGERIVVKLFQNANIMSVKEVFVDGHPRLQQSFLSTLCFLFSHLSDSNSSALQPIRHYILSNADMIQAIFKLSEQGSTSVAQAKALLLLGFIIRQFPQALCSLPERRFVSSIVKVLDPTMSSQVGLQGTSRSEYHFKIANLVVLMLNNILVAYFRTLADKADKIRQRAHMDERGAILDILKGTDVLRTVFSMCSHLALRKLVVLSHFDRLCGVYGSCARKVRELTSYMKTSTAIADVDDRSNLLAVLQSFLSMSIEVMTQVDCFQFGDNEVATATVVSHELFPLVVKVFEDGDGDSRVVSIASMRRILPEIIRIFASSPLRAAHEKVVESLLIEFIRVAGLGLVEEAPIPQYTIRTLCDVLGSSHALIKSVPIIETLQHHRIYETSTKMLFSQCANTADFHIDVQLIALIRLLFENIKDVSLFHAQFLPDALMTIWKTITSHSRKEIDFSTEARFELFLNVLDLIHVILNFCISCVAKQNNPDSSLFQRLRTWTHPFVSLFPSMIEILGFACSNGNVLFGFSNITESLLPKLCEVCSRCLGILFDLQSDLISRGLLQDRSMRVISAVISNSNIDLKIRLRSLKILWGMVKVVKSSDIPELKRLILSEPVNSALEAAKNGSEIQAHNEDMLKMKEQIMALSRQILSQAMKMN